MIVIGLDVYNQALTGDVAKALNSAATDSDHIPCVIEVVNGADSNVEQSVPRPDL